MRPQYTDRLNLAVVRIWVRQGLRPVWALQTANRETTALQSILRTKPRIWLHFMRFAFGETTKSEALRRHNGLQRSVQALAASGGYSAVAVYSLFTRSQSIW